MRGAASSVFCLFLVLLSVALSGCGGGSSNSGSGGTPPQASVTVQGPQSATVMLGQTAQFNAVVQNISNTAVTWQVNSVAGGNSTVGTISSAGLYTAPAVIPSPNQIQITAVSVATPTVSGSASFTLSSNIVVTVSPQIASVIEGQTQQFSVNVQNAFNVGVTWQVNGVAGGPCHGTFCDDGFVDGSGLYTAPQSTMTVTITAVSVADPSKSGSATVTVTPHVNVSISPQATPLLAGKSVQLSATVQNTSNTAVNWSIALPGAQIGSISSAGVYTAPASVSNLTIVLITATSVVDATIVGEAVIAVYAPSSSDTQMQGSYAFSFVPGNFVGDGTAVYAGSIVADGSGAITTGIVDNIGVGPASSTFSNPVIGAYMIGPNNQGQLALLPTQPNSGQVLVFQVALGSFNQGTAGRAFIGSWGSYGPAQLSSTGNGVLLAQDSAAFATSTLNGSYAFGTPIGGNEFLAGGFQADGAGNLASGSIDSNSGGLALSDAPFTGTYSVDSTDGRGTATLNIPTVGAINVVFYVVSAQKFLWVGSTPNGGAFAGSALPQSGAPFSTASLNGTTVFTLSASAGIMTADGNGNITGTVDGSEDNADGGGDAVTDQPFTGTYTVSANGRGSLSIFNQNFVIWLVNQNSAFIVEAPNGAAVQAGFMEPQAAGPFGVASISGPFATGGNSGPLDQTAGYNASQLFGTFSADGNGNVTGNLVSIVEPEPASYLCEAYPSLSGPYNPSCSFTGTYSISANGRGTITGTVTPNNPLAPTASSVIYMVSPNAFVTVGKLGVSFLGP
jgi:hypothetical protein